MRLDMFRGDGVTFMVPLTWEGVPYMPAPGEVLIFTVKRQDSDPDTLALIQKTSGVGLTTLDTNAVVEIVHEDTMAYEESVLGVFDVQGQVAGESPKTLHKGTVLVRLDTTRGTTTSVAIYTTNPPANVGADYVDTAVLEETNRALAAEQVLADQIAAGGPGGGVTSVNTRTGAVVLTKSDVGLANVDNTADAEKPVSTLQAAAIAAAQAASRPVSYVPAWTEVTGKPTSFAPSAHTHDWTEVTGKPTLFSGAYADLTGTPLTFAPSSHTHAQSDVTGLSSDLTALASDIDAEASRALSAESGLSSSITSEISRATSAEASLAAALSGISAGGGGDMYLSDNLAGLANTTTARSNLGLGTAAVAAASDFATPSSIAVLQYEIDAEVSRATSVEAGKAATSHTHAQSDVTGLVSDLVALQSDIDAEASRAVAAEAGKAAASHAHAQSDVTGLSSDLTALASDIAAIEVGGVPAQSDADVIAGTSTEQRTASAAQLKLAAETWGGGGGGGGTKTLTVFSALDFQPPATNYATLDTRNSVAVLDFDDATVESMFAIGIIPEAAVLTSGVLIRIHWSAATVSSGNVRWRAEIWRLNTDLDVDSYDTAAEATSATTVPNGIVNTVEITLTTIDGCVAGSAFAMRITRVASDATNDTLLNDAELVLVEVRGVA